MQNEVILEVKFSPSNEVRQVPLQDLVAGVTAFLDLYGEENLVGAELRALIGDGDGETRFERLLEGAGHGGDPRGFFAEVLAQLARATGEARARISAGEVELPYHLLLAILERVIPGEDVANVKSVRRLERLTNTTVPPAQQEAIQKVLDTYPVRLSSHVIRQMRLSPDVAYQYMPFADELDREGLAHTWVGQFHRGVIEQMYRNRVIFVLNMSCPVYCRFCFRKHKECRTQRAPSQRHVDLGVVYIRECPEIKEVVLTGGDPFMNRPTLTRAVERLAGIPHVETLRLATRSLSYYPALFTAKNDFWLTYLTRKQLELQQKGKRLELATHFIHPDEISVQVLHMISELVSNGVPVYVQTPFLGGCNDTGEILADLFRQLRAAGAEMHYIFMPCSPIQGNARYASTLASGFESARYLRAHLSDRAVPHLCTATAIGKVDWGTSGWVVETDPDDERYLWIRTPYTQEFFERFAPILDLSRVARLNSEGTLDARFMVEVGDPRWTLGPRESMGLPRTFLERERFPAEAAAEALRDLQSRSRDSQCRGYSVVATGSPSLFRPHETRVELDCDAPEGDLDLAFRLLEEDPRVSDVVLFSERDAIRSLGRLRGLLDRLAAISNVTAVRLRSWSLVSEPEALSEGLLRRLTEANRLRVANPTRVEVEVQILHPSEITPALAKAVRVLRRHGVTVYNNTPLLAFVNDAEEEVVGITGQCRRIGIEMHHLVLAGLPVQEEWSLRHPIHASQVVDLASHLRRAGSGRELPRFVIRTVLGEVDFGLTAELAGADDDRWARVKLLAYTLEDFKALQPDFSCPEGVEVDDEGHPIVAVPGLTA